MYLQSCTNDYGTTYNDDFMKKCQLSPDNYTKTGPFVGEGGANCTDPKIFHSQASASFKNLGIEKIVIWTYEKQYTVIIGIQVDFVSF